MTEINERTGILEVKVENIENKLLEFKQEVKEDTREIKDTLKLMAENSTKQHRELHEKIVSIEKTNHGWVMWMLGASAVISAIIGLYNTFK